MLYVPLLTIGKIQKIYTLLSKSELSSYEIVYKEHQKILNNYLILNHMYKKQLDSALLKEEFKRYDIPIKKATIFLKKNSNYEQKIYIDVGLKNGIKDNDTVVYKGLLLGKIEKAFQNYSIVSLIFENQNKVGVYFLSDDSVKGIMNGINSQDLLEVHFVKNGEKIKEDVIVYTSGDGGIYPSGFAVGKVKKIVMDNYLYATIFLEPLIDLNLIEECFVLVDENVENSEHYDKLINSFFQETYNIQAALLLLEEQKKNKMETMELIPVQQTIIEQPIEIKINKKNSQKIKENHNTLVDDPEKKSEKMRTKRKSRENKIQEKIPATPVPEKKEMESEHIIVEKNTSDSEHIVELKENDYKIDEMIESISVLDVDLNQQNDDQDLY